MDIQKINQQHFNWQQMTAKEILQKKNEGENVPSEYQKWAAAITASLATQDDVTYEMVNGETDIAAIDEALGKSKDKIGQVKPAGDIDRGVGDKNKNDKQFENQQAIQSPEEQEQEDVTLADVKITTDPNEILKRKMRKGIEPQQLS